MADEKKDLWVQDVETEWHPPEGFFDSPAINIAEGLKAASKDRAQAMDRLNFYINRAGSNLDDAARARLEESKQILESLYTA